MLAKVGEVLAVMAPVTPGSLLQVGFCTLYTFFNYPDRKRFRLSQIFVLPPYQRHGIGAALLKAAYALAAECNAVDVTVRLAFLSYQNS